MSFIELASICFLVGALLSLLNSGYLIVVDNDAAGGIRSLVAAFVLSGVALWSWRIAAAGEAFVEALR